MSNETLNHTSTEEILASIRKIMSTEWQQPTSPKIFSVEPEDEDILELTRKVESPQKETPHHLPLPASSASPSRGTQSAEDLLSALLRPLLKDWLNQHLPSIIEKEIQKRSLS
jgi:cell pole-organizing protein PopZ